MFKNEAVLFLLVSAFMDAQMVEMLCITLLEGPIFFTFTEEKISIISQAANSVVKMTNSSLPSVPAPSTAMARANLMNLTFFTWHRLNRGSQHLHFLKAKIHQMRNIPHRNYSEQSMEIDEVSRSWVDDGCCPTFIQERNTDAKYDHLASFPQLFIVL